MPTITDYLKTDFTNLDPLEVLQSPTSVLQGVTSNAADELKSLAVHTVFDLAFSATFGNARRLLDYGADSRSTYARYGAAPADVVDTGGAVVEVDELPWKDLSLLYGVGVKTGAKLKQALDVKTIRDLALWPPYRAARAIADLTINPEASPGFDPEAPSDLLPKTGDYPTERVFYETLLLDEIEDDPRKLMPLEEAGRIDVLQAVGADFGFGRPALGAILKFSQSWYTQGVALGQLLHSVALAPGESTRIAMIDWSRRVRGTTEEEIAQSEQLSNTVVHNRAISEVTRAVATEAQSGFSRTQVSSRSEEGGIAGGVVNFGGGLLGGSYGTASSTGTGTSFSSSFGRRDLTASMSQQVMDSTHQAAHSARNRRASVVMEVSQAESESISTRAITNFNHMHALSVQYYEVVQLYRVEVRLSEVSRCLFVPMKPLDFRTEAEVNRFREVLAGAALNDRIRRMLANDPETITFRAPRAQGWVAGQLEVASSRVGRSVLTSTGKLNLPPSAVLTAATFEQKLGTARPVRAIIQRRGGGQIPTPFAVDLNDDQIRDTRSKVQFDPVVPLHDVEWVDLEVTGVRGEDGMPSVDLEFKVGDESFSISIPGVYDLLTRQIPNGRLLTADVSHGDDLLAHLRSHRMHYSQAIWRSLDSSTMALLLSPYRYNGAPVTQLVDPTPAAVAGNYVAFRMHVDPGADKKWAAWLKEHGINTKRVEQEIIPLSSGGVFAEAVLGRYNSAEKLDMTRFWNWQDSPIPIVAPEIAPTAAGSRRETIQLEPGELGAPVLNIVNPPAIPDPTGISSALSAISNGNMFRDMSGLAGMIGLTEAALAATSAGAGRAAGQAGANMATAADFHLQMVKAILPLIAAAMGLPLPPSGSGESISNQGAKINQGQGMDRRRGQPSGTPENGGGGPLPGGILPGGPPEGGGTGTTTWAATAGPGGSMEELAFRNTMSGPLGTLAAPASTRSTNGGATAPAAAGGEKPGALVLAGIDADARLKESFDRLTLEGWQLRRRNLWLSNSDVDREERILYIDDDPEPVATTTRWIADATRRAYMADDALRLTAIRDKAIEIFTDPEPTDLEKMARTYEWAAWFWRFPSNDGDPVPLLDDMMLVLTDTAPSGVRQNDGTNYIFRRQGVNAECSGFKREFRETSNQVRHATGSLQASITLGLAGLGVMQTQEVPGTADWRLNVKCYDIASALKTRQPDFKARDIGTVLRRELGDPDQVGEWNGPPAGDPDD